MKTPPQTVLTAVLVLLARTAFAEESTATFAGKHFTFSSAYTLELAAGQPLVERPIEACFDKRGRLYVTESSGSNEPAQKQLEKKPHRVLRLVDTDGDGRFDQRTVFAEGLMFPEGCLWHEDALYVAAPPQIWKFTDMDDDGVAEKREVWFDGKTLTGCANDLHGPYAGPDGWIYWCKGAFAEQTYDLPGELGWKTSASHVFRARPDGSGLEPVFTAGMDNPVGVTWTPEGEMVVCGTFVQNPADGRRDGLIHAVYGGVWGKTHDVLAGHPLTGALMPPMTHLGPGAPCGLASYGRDLLVTQFNLRTVSRHTLIDDGATYHTEDFPFLTCDHPDFHPTDVLQAPDGSVLILDTGGWYKLCCPTSQLAKPNVLGGIYRMRKTGGEIPASTPSPLWTVGDPSNAELQIKNLESLNPHVRRRAAEILGRIHARAAVPALLKALAAPNVDRFLFHSLTYALRQIQDPAAIRPALLSTNPAVQAAALYALEQMPEGNLTAAKVINLLAAGDPRLEEAAAFVVVRHREWAGELKPWFIQRLQTVAGDDPVMGNVMRGFINEPVIRQWIGGQLGEITTIDGRDFLLRLMAGSRAKTLPSEWIEPLIGLLNRGDAAELIFAVLAAAPPSAESGFDPVLRRIAADETQPVRLRLSALARKSTPELDDTEFTLVIGQLHIPAAAPLLAKARLTPLQQLQLAPLVGSSGILERSQLLKAFVSGKDLEVGRALLDSIASILASLPRESLAEAFASFPESIRKQLELAQLAVTSPDQRARVDALEKTLGAGDIQRGAVLFQSSKASCASCHPVGYKGGHLGPDLSRIGTVRTRRDLIEAIVYPSASFARSYETVQLIARDGSETYGIVTNQNAEVLTLATAPATLAVSISRSEIKTLLPAAFSLMPQGFDQILSSGELADIVAYLQSMR
ncbi:MAG: dehydrogenase [Chthoniobacteraceae bacterium]|nr:dehydrogenase [Chthoniobacteraceae bacterium]